MLKAAALCLMASAVVGAIIWLWDSEESPYDSQRR
jgi:hypothetical protein